MYNIYVFFFCSPHTDYNDDDCQCCTVVLFPLNFVVIVVILLRKRAFKSEFQKFAETVFK